MVYLTPIRVATYAEIGDQYEHRTVEGTTEQDEGVEGNEAGQD
jgi:hypothetical protein